MTLECVKLTENWPTQWPQKGILFFIYGISNLCSLYFLQFSLERGLSILLVFKTTVIDSQASLFYALNFIDFNSNCSYLLTSIYIVIFIIDF